MHGTFPIIPASRNSTIHRLYFNLLPLCRTITLRSNNHTCVSSNGLWLVLILLLLSLIIMMTRLGWTTWKKCERVNQRARVCYRLTPTTIGSHRSCQQQLEAALFTSFTYITETKNPAPPQKSALCLPTIQQPTPITIAAYPLAMLNQPSSHISRRTPLHPLDSGSPATMTTTPTSSSYTKLS